MKVLTKKYGEVIIRWEYGLFNGDRDVTKAFLEKKEGKNSTVIKEISVVKNLNFDGIGLLGALWKEPENAITNFNQIKYLITNNL